MTVAVQLLLNVAASASHVFMLACGFGIIYRASRFIHFAHGIVFTAGAYVAFAAFSHQPSAVSYGQEVSLAGWAVVIVAGIVGAGVLGCLMEVAIYRPLRKRGSNELILLLASLGIYIVLQNVISMVFGDQTQSIRSGVVKEGINILGARITPIQITTIVVSIVLTAGLWLFLRVSKIGRAMRAVANDPVLASVSGINSNAIILWAFAIGSALAGLAGILVALDVDMTPTMGMNALMMGVVAVIIGGVNSIPGIALGALLLAAAQHLGAWYIGSQWQDAIAFVVLVVFLLFRPQGFLGRRLSKEVA